ncbi:MAG: 16S rRNA (uracil(1498)-N(3))-methyltransferase [Flavobacteriaceae bacterium]|nr:16S rRNA (uracil(1498)-N(3))-methyltransferase [Flavobacteriaceae bacterium]
MQLFYHPEANEVNQELVFDREESKHIIKVLRKQVGDILNITNGLGFFYISEISVANHNKCIVKITEETPQQPLPYQLHLAVAPTKLNDRYEWFLEKATEIGITEITPVYCKHSERTKIKQERYEKILQSAMKQSLKAFLPKLNNAISFKEFIQLNAENPAKKYIAHCAEGEKISLKNVLQAGEDVLILIGPEGDFALSEIELALENNFSAVSLGESRLRTETAAIVACHSAAFVNE